MNLPRSTLWEGTDTAPLKKVRDAFLYLRGASLSRSVGPGDERESVQLRSIPVDKVVFDELDLMGAGVIAKAQGRMGASKVKQEVYLSNPTGPDRGIAKVFAASDQRHWHRRCGCGAWTCAEVSFPNCVHVRPDGTGYIACDKCGKELPPLSSFASSEGGWLQHARWVAHKPDNTAYLHGYHVLAPAFGTGGADTDHRLVAFQLETLPLQAGQLVGPQARLSGQLVQQGPSAV